MKKSIIVNLQSTATAVATLTGTTLATIAVATAGTGYTTAPTVTVTGGGGIGATATATVASGGITAFTVTAGGTGYTSAPTITITPVGGAGSGGVGTATITATSIASITVTSGGAGYTAVPTVTIGSGAATGTAVLELNNTGKVASVTIGGTNSGYTVAPSVTIANQGLTAQASGTMLGSRVVVTNAIVGEAEIVGATLNVSSTSTSFVSATTFDVFVMNAASVGTYAPVAAFALTATDIDKLTGVINFSATSNVAITTTGVAFYQLNTAAIPGQLGISIVLPTGTMTVCVVMRSALATTSTSAVINLTLHLSQEGL